MLQFGILLKFAELSRSLELREWLTRANLSMSLSECNIFDLPKWVQDELERKEHFARKVTSLENKVAYRPDPSQVKITMAHSFQS